MKYLIYSGVAQEVPSNGFSGSGIDLGTELFLAAYFFSSSGTFFEGSCFGASLTIDSGT
jgi:hypothetical protein